MKFLRSSFLYTILVLEASASVVTPENAVRYGNVNLTVMASNTLASPNAEYRLIRPTRSHKRRPKREPQRKRTRPRIRPLSHSKQYSRKKAFSTSIECQRHCAVSKTCNERRRGYTCDNCPIGYKKRIRFGGACTQKVDAPKSEGHRWVPGRARNFSNHSPDKDYKMRLWTANKTEKTGTFQVGFMIDPSYATEQELGTRNVYRSGRQQREYKQKIKRELHAAVHFVADKLNCITPLELIDLTDEPYRASTFPAVIYISDYYQDRHTLHFKRCTPCGKSHFGMQSKYMYEKPNTNYKRYYMCINPLRDCVKIRTIRSVFGNILGLTHADEFGSNFAMNMQVLYNFDETVCPCELGKSNGLHWCDDPKIKCSTTYEQCTPRNQFWIHGECVDSNRKCYQERYAEIEQAGKDGNSRSSATMVDKIAFFDHGNPKVVHIQNVKGSIFSAASPVKIPRDSAGEYVLRPYLAYHAKLQVLELVGDRWKQDVKYHHHVRLDNATQEIQDSRYDGRRHSTMTYTEELGTVMVGGVYDSSALATVLQITPTDTELSIPTLPGAAWRVSLVYHDKTLWSVGGYDRHSLSSVFKLDLTDLHSLRWQTMSPLEGPVAGATTAITGNMLMVAGDTDSDRKGVEFYNLDTQKSEGFKADIFHADIWMGCSITSESKLTVFGGYSFDDGVAYQAQFGSTHFEKVAIESMEDTHDKWSEQICATFQVHH